MWFPSLLVCQRRRVQDRRANLLPRRYRPCLERLEDRLPPGDVLFGGLLSWSWLQAGPRLSSQDPLGSACAVGLGRPAPLRSVQQIALAPDQANRAHPALAHAAAGARHTEVPGPGRRDLGRDAGQVLAQDTEAGPGWDRDLGWPWPARTARPNAPSAGTETKAAYPADGPMKEPAVVRDEAPAAPRPGQAGAAVADPRADADLLVRLAGTVTAAGAPGRGAEPPPRAPGDPAPLAAVSALFDLHDTRGGPFPSDRWTVPDATQNTGRRINLPLPDPATHPSDYEDVLVLNTLDGFNLQPRLSVPFSGPIDVSTVTSNTVFLVSLGDTLDRHDRGGQVVGINQVVWDVATSTLHVESDELLDQHTRYALVVTDGVRVADGRPVEASAAFRRFRQEVRGAYKQDLLDAVQAARRLGVREEEIVTASVFTTLSATAVLEKIRDQIHAATPEPADFLLGPNGERTVFNLGEVMGITFNRQTSVGGALSDEVVDLRLPRIVPGAVGQIAFGKYLSPNYLTPARIIPAVGTRTGNPSVLGVEEVFFNLYLPSSSVPKGGWPVAIFGHGTPDHKNGSPAVVAATMASQGIATIAINVAGHGFGPLSTLTVFRSTGGQVTFSAGGRGIDLNNDNVIGPMEGRDAPAPWTIVDSTDTRRQTVADMMQLVRVIEVGMDVDGDGFQDLDPSRIYYLGVSFGGSYGAAFLAVEPGVHVGVLNVGGGPFNESRRLGINRLNFGSRLEARTPSLINPPGLTSIGGIPAALPRYNENLPLRNLPPVINTVAGAIEIQQVLEHSEWVEQLVSPVAFAPHLRKDPLAGVPAKKPFQNPALAGRSPWDSRTYVKSSGVLKRLLSRSSSSSPRGTRTSRTRLQRRYSGRGTWPTEPPSTATTWPMPRTPRCQRTRTPS